MAVSGSSFIYLGVFLVVLGILQAAVPPEKTKSSKLLDRKNKVIVTVGNVDECLVCDPFTCPDVKKCNAGVVRDRCGCCDVCAIEEGHLCNMKPYQPGKSQIDMGGDPAVLEEKVGEVWYGHCGVDLECRERTDVDHSLVGSQSICYCMKEGHFCGSDGKTYSWCKMKEIEIATNNATTMISHGPCKTEPKIISIAESQIVPQNSRVSLLCEVEGYPTPTIVWFHLLPDTNNPVKLPGDSDEISVSFRGGPQAMRISSHLQITQFSTKHEGSYRCFADNDMGMVMKEFSLVVGPQQQAKKF
jgi:hypothetical protein